MTGPWAPGRYRARGTTTLREIHEHYHQYQPIPKPDSPAFQKLCRACELLNAGQLAEVLSIGAVLSTLWSLHCHLIPAGRESAEAEDVSASSGH